MAIVEALKRLNPAEPATPFYIDRPRSVNLADQLEVLLAASQRPRILLHGAIGVGKTTELAAIERRLSDVADVARIVVAPAGTADTYDVHSLLWSALKQRFSHEGLDTVLATWRNGALKPGLFCPGLALLDIDGPLAEGSAFLDTGQTFDVLVRWDEAWRGRIQDVRRDTVRGHGGRAEAFVFSAVLTGLPQPQGAPVTSVEVWAVEHTPHPISVGLPLLVDRYDLGLAKHPYELRLR